ncbi:MAG TPA: GlsB/YeaQ/YmgE family stress response membrane protein [Thermohalobaculum sp.]|nr:GlsB/YeaQ/YmgE family stress response membrane protein [Thermohalobaculum sp.]
MAERAGLTARGIGTMLLMGLIAGWLASWVLGGGGLIKYVIWGVLGSFVGGLVLPRVGLDIRTGSRFWDDILTATIGAIILVVLARIIT